VELVTIFPKCLCGLTRLGNKLFMVASAIGIAEDYGAKFVLYEGKYSVKFITLIISNKT